MSGSSPKLRLGPLPRTENTKLTVNVSAALKASLDDYATAHSRIHGEAVDAATLIPHMLQAFIARDRGFNALRSRRPTKSSANPPDAQ
jgi:hypothetical protein